MAGAEEQLGIRLLSLEQQFQAWTQKLTDLDLRMLESARQEEETFKNRADWRRKATEAKSPLSPDRYAASQEASEPLAFRCCEKLTNLQILLDSFMESQIRHDTRLSRLEAHLEQLIEGAKQRPQMSETNFDEESEVRREAANEDISEVSDLRPGSMTWSTYGIAPSLVEQLQADLQRLQAQTEAHQSELEMLRQEDRQLVIKKEFSTSKTIPAGGAGQADWPAGSLEAEIRALRDCIASAETAVFSLAPRLLGAALQDGTVLKGTARDLQDAACCHTYSQKATPSTRSHTASPEKEGPPKKTEEQNDLEAYKETMSLLVGKAPATSPGRSSRSALSPLLYLVDIAHSGSLLPQGPVTQIPSGSADAKAQTSAQKAMSDSIPEDGDEETTTDTDAQREEELEAYKETMKQVVGGEAPVRQTWDRPPVADPVGHGRRSMFLVECFEFVLAPSTFAFRRQVRQETA